MAEGEFWGQLERWRKNGEYGMIIGVIEALPAERLDIRLKVELARAYCELAVATSDIDRDMLTHAEDLLEGVTGDVDDDAGWNACLGSVLFHLGKYEDALSYLERAESLDPDNGAFESMLAVCRGYCGGEGPTEVYDDVELSAVEEHIREHFGGYKNVLHEIYSPDIHLDICIIPPNAAHNCYTLVTLGMGAHKMDLPDDLSHEMYGRAELMISLPPDWDIDACMTGSGGEKWYWPLRLLKTAARLPIENETWLGWGHTVSASTDNSETYDESVGFSGVMLVTPGAYDKDAYACRLPSGDEVNFYQLVPLYPTEIEYKLKNNADSLLDLLTDKMLSVVDTSRPAVIDKNGGEIGYGLIVDDVHIHLETIKKKSLPVDEAAACSHMAIYLRFCIEHDLMSDVFLDACPEIEYLVRSRFSVYDLRRFIRRDDRCRGVITLPFFNCDGVDFTKWYYLSDDDSHSFFRDICDYAERYFGKKRCESQEFKGEAYLFLPWGDEYYREMSKVIESRFEQWIAGTEEPEGDPYISRDELSDILPDDFTGPRGCLATDRIIIDGEPVAVACREIPEPADRGWDSGWRFMTADEYDEYIDGGEESDIDDKFAVYDLNTVCNYESRLIDLLDSPYGACFERGDDGKYYRFDEQ